MGAISVDRTGFPLVRIRLDGKQTDADVDLLLEDFGSFLGGEPYLALVEIRDYKSDFDHVRRIGRWTMENLDGVRASVGGAVLVIPSDMFRLMLSTFMLITPLPCPFHVTTELEEAVDWVTAQAAEQGLELPI